MTHQSRAIRPLAARASMSFQIRRERRTSARSATKDSFVDRSGYNISRLRTCDRRGCSAQAFPIPPRLLARIHERAASTSKFANCSHLCTKCVKVAYIMFHSNRAVERLVTSELDVFPSSIIYKGEAPSVLKVRRFIILLFSHNTC